MSENGAFLKLTEAQFGEIIPEPGSFYRVIEEGGAETLYLGSLRLDNTDIDMETLKDLKYATSQQIQDIINGTYNYDFNESTNTETVDPYDVEEATDRDIEILLENYYKN